LQDGASYSYDSSKRELVSYDTPDSVRQKSQYIANNGLAGAMFWELSGDKIGGESLVGITAGAFGTLDQTPNHIKYALGSALFVGRKLNQRFFFQIPEQQVG